jgi:hypothetical protein
VPYVAYIPGEKSYPQLSGELREKWQAIDPSISQGATYRPCCVTLKSGQIVDCVYVIEAQEYIDTWGVWPEDDGGKRRISMDDVVSIVESPFRLPVKFANQIYRAGESGMGYTVFTLEFLDGARAAYVTGNAVDFVSLPDRRAMSEIRRVLPHIGRDDNPSRTPPYYWCLFGSGVGHHESKRFT